MGPTVSCQRPHARTGGRLFRDSGNASGLFVHGQRWQHHPSHPEFAAAKANAEARLKTLFNIQGKRTVDSFHRQLGLLVWDKCGMAQRKKTSGSPPRDPGNPGRVLGECPGARQRENLNMELEKAGRVADFLEFGELMCQDALSREESCGGHFREEHQYTDADPSDFRLYFCRRSQAS
ncbi:MAG: hypothetical protein R3F31_05770 [Verrucomicrobiales bacterium]